LIECAADKYSERVVVARPAKPLEQGKINLEVVPDTKQGVWVGMNNKVNNNSVISVTDIIENLVKLRDDNSISEEQFQIFMEYLHNKEPKNESVQENDQVD